MQYFLCIYLYIAIIYSLSEKNCLFSFTIFHIGQTFFSGYALKKSRKSYFTQKQMDEYVVQFQPGSLHRPK